MGNNLILYQMFEHESSTYTYLLADSTTLEAVIIDPVLETVDRDVRLISELNLKLKYVLDTHIHADHITGAGRLREKLKAQTAVGEHAQVDCVDILLKDNQELQFGSHTIRAVATPGHTDSCMSYIVNDMVFTGDTLLIRGTGRTDFQQGSAEKLYHSIQRIFNLGDHFTIYPGHDYRGQTKSTVALEKKFNPRIGNEKTKDEFIQIMNELKLAHPKKIMEALPANLACGIKKNTFDITHNNGIRETTVENVYKNLSKPNLKLIDVREAHEFNGELGHIQTAQLCTLGTSLEVFLNSVDQNDEIIFICRSGARSGVATQQSQKLGFKHTVNMQGGMLQWNEKKLPVTKE